MYEANPAEVLSFVHTWTRLRSTVTKQVERILYDYVSDDGWNVDTEAAVVPRAIRHAAQKLKGHNEMIDSILAEYLEQYDGARKAA